MNKLRASDLSNVTCKTLKIIRLVWSGLCLIRLARSAEKTVKIAEPGKVQLHCMWQTYCTCHAPVPNAICRDTNGESGLWKPPCAILDIWLTWLTAWWQQFRNICALVAWEMQTTGREACSERTCSGCRGGCGGRCFVRLKSLLFRYQWSGGQTSTYWRTHQAAVFSRTIQLKYRTDLI